MNSSLTNAVRSDATWQTSSSISGLEARLAAWAPKYRALMAAGGGALPQEHANAGKIDFGDGKGYKAKKAKKGAHHCSNKGRV